MKRVYHAAILFGLAAACDAHAMGGIADVAIVDRDSGTVLAAHYCRGEYWVAGRPGARYSIQIRNRLGERVLAVTSVDGVNVVSGETAAWGQSGYVFDPGESYQITGWRKTDAEVAAFTFTDAPNSYAQRTGRPANIGVIGVALFRERQAEPAYVPPVIGRPSQMSQSPTARAAGAGESLDAKASPGAPAALAEDSLASKLGTGHGEREYSHVSHTEFSRLQNQPNEVIRIRYDSLDNLFAMGIIKRPRATAPAINPFPATPEPQYVPDPPG